MTEHDEHDGPRGGAPPAANPVPERDFPSIRTVDERTMLLGMLDWYRDGVVAKVAGLDEAGARRRLLGSDTTIIGLVKHLALVEDSWFTDRFAHRPEPAPWADAPWDSDVDWDFHSALDDRLADVVALYRAACERSRSAYASAGLDDLNAKPISAEYQFTLRYALVHLIEETARHLGHLDVLRELTDGVTGE